MRTASEEKRSDALRGVSDRALTSDTSDRDRDALGEAARIGLVGDQVERFHVVRRADQAALRHGRHAVFEEILIRSGGQLAGIVHDRFILGGLADLLERGNRHGGQEADDDDDDHDFDEGETLAGVANVFHGSNYLYLIYLIIINAQLRAVGKLNTMTRSGSRSKSRKGPNHTG